MPRRLRRPIPGRQAGRRNYRRGGLPSRNSPAKYIALAAAFGLAIGLGSIMIQPGGTEAIGQKVKPFAVRWGLIRARSPQPGDYWNNCDEARAAGTAPIASTEPGYRQGLDGDYDGIACEPYRKR
ncbi:excalibur calcium-binding domain-containing protein [Croceicoccus sp. 1NDH52]|nr:excalibur calcium-binding domain-containing protein [Croceicoccus gelatinilyticus]